MEAVIGPRSQPSRVTALTGTVAAAGLQLVVPRFPPLLVSLKFAELDGYQSVFGLHPPERPLITFWHLTPF